MELNDGRISISLRDEKVFITITDRDACTDFCKVELTSEQFTTALGSLRETPCKVETHFLDRVGLTMKNKRLEAHYSDESLYGDEDRKKIALKALLLKCPNGWLMDKYLGSQDSFFRKGDQEWAGTTIRRWV